MMPVQFIPILRLSNTGVPRLGMVELYIVKGIYISLEPELPAFVSINHGVSPVCVESLIDTEASAGQ